MLVLSTRVGSLVSLCFHHIQCLNRLVTSKLTRGSSGLVWTPWRRSANLVEFITVNIVCPDRGVRILARSLAGLKVGDPMQDTMGFMGTSFLFTFGSPCVCGGSEYQGVRASQKWSSTYPSFWRCFRDSLIFSTLIDDPVLASIIQDELHLPCVRSSALVCRNKNNTLISLEVLDCSSLLEGQVRLWGCHYL